MAKSYTELEAWGIFVGALIIGVVVTSVFWAFITVPQEAKITGKEIKNASLSITMDKPDDFISFCEKIDGISNWDNKGFRQCIVGDSSEKNLIVMNLLCKKFNLSLTYGSFGAKCEGRV